MAKSWAARLCRLPQQELFVAQELIKTVKLKCCGIKDDENFDKERTRPSEFELCLVWEISTAGQTFKIMDDSSHSATDCGSQCADHHCHRRCSGSRHWAVAFREGSVKHVYFVAESKGNDLQGSQLRGSEESKIECARRHFKAISDNGYIYDVAKDYKSLYDIVMK